VSLNNVAEIRAPEAPPSNGGTNTPQPSNGDLTNDGVVDAADYVLWRKQGGSEQSYEDWLKHFGTTS
jgi:hypothetical protein